MCLQLAYLFLWSVSFETIIQTLKLEVSNISGFSLIHQFYMLSGVDQLSQMLLGFQRYMVGVTSHLTRWLIFKLNWSVCMDFKILAGHIWKCCLPLSTDLSVMLELSLLWINRENLRTALWLRRQYDESVAIDKGNKNSRNTSQEISPFPFLPSSLITHSHQLYQHASCTCCQSASLLLLK